MILKIISIILICIASYTTGDSCSHKDVYTHSSTEYLLSLIPLNPIDVFDGPVSISGAATTTTTQSWSEEDLKYYNHYAAATYCSYTLANLTCCYCTAFNEDVIYHKIITNGQYGTLAFIALDPNRNEIVASFRGSVALMNWVMDFTIFSISVNPDIRIHSGFYLCLMSVYNEVVQEVGNLLTQNPDYRVVVTGHSLGGSMATLFTFFMEYLQQFPETSFALVTYGCPRLGNKGFVDYMNSLTIPMARVTARADIIAHLFPVTVIGLIPILTGMKYYHTMQEVWINGSTTKFCTRTKYEDFTCSNSMGPSYSLLDHLQYFDLDYTVCDLAEDFLNMNIASLPTGFVPTNYIPPLPTFISNFTTPLLTGGFQGVLPLLG